MSSSSGKWLRCDGDAGASFDYRYADGELCLMDLGGDRISVTNDAERVIAKLAAIYASSWPPRFVIYRDSEGVWDGIELDARGHFAGFYPLQEISTCIALEAARDRNRK